VVLCSSDDGTSGVHPRVVVLMKHFDRVTILSSIIYGGAMMIGYISYEVGKYRHRKKELLDNLP
jgi:hypothetical protein